MIKEKNYQLTPGLVDSIKKFSNRSAKIVTVAAVAAVASTGAANALAFANGQTITENTTNTTSSQAISNDGSEVITTANDAGTIGVIIDANNVSATAPAAGMGIDTLISTGTGAGILTMTITDSSAQADDFTIAGDVTAGSNTDANDVITMNLTTGDVIALGNIVQTAATNVITFNVGASREASFVGDNKAINASIQGTVAGQGKIIVGHANNTTFAQTLGGVKKVAEVEVVASKAAIFSLDVNATLVDAIGSMTAKGNITGEVKLGAGLFTSSIAATNVTITGNVSERGSVVSKMDFVNSSDESAIKTTITGTVVIDAADVGTTAKGGSLLLNSNATITDLDIVGGNQAGEASQVEFKGNLISATGITLDKETGGAKLLASGTGAQTVTGVVLGIGAGNGTLQVTNTHASGVTFTAAVGSTTLLLADIDTVATFNGALGAATINNAGTMIVTGAGVATATVLTGTSTFSSTLTSAAVTTTAGTQIFNGKVTASTGLIISGANTEVTLAGAAHDMGDLDLTDGTLFVNIKDSDVGKLDLNSGEIIVAKTIVNGESVFKVTSQDAAGINAAGSVTMPITLTEGQSLTLLDGATANAATAVLVDAVVNDNALIDYQATKTGLDVTVKAVIKSATTTASELAVTTNEAIALEQAFNAIQGTSAEEDIFFNVLTAKGGMTATADTSLAEQISPQNDAIAGSAVSTRAMTGTVQGIVSNRMASLRSGDAYVSGVSAGEGMSANSGFIQAFGSQVEQGSIKKGTATVHGYDAETAGVALGFDGLTDSGSTIGLSASYSTTDVDGLGKGKAKNSIDSYTVSVYADKSTDSGYLEGSLTYGINDNSSSRKVNTAGIVRDYTSTYDSEQVSLKLSAGNPNEVSADTFVTPYISASGTLLTQDSYTEKSTAAADTLRLNVSQEDMESLVGTVGVKVHKVTSNGTPMISLAINNEFGDTKINSSNTYQGGGTAFTTTSDIEAMSATLGLGYSFGNDMTSLNIGYEGEVNDAEYVNHYGSIKLVSKF